LPPSPAPHLAPGEVHLWHADSGCVTSPEELRACIDLLDESERARMQRLRFDSDRRAYLVAHVLVRSALSVYAAVPARSWRFRRTGRGKPVIAAPTEYRALSFSLSHAPGRVACAIAFDREVGVDIEQSERMFTVADLTDRYLSRAEAEAVRALAPGAQADRFLAYWTLKEAYLKARGLGLSVPLHALTFHLHGPRGAHLELDPVLEDDPKSWSFLRVVTGRHAMALAVRRGADPGVTVHVHETPTVPIANTAWTAA
jgi:4'-phosphopantetheinyl transferase